MRQFFWFFPLEVVVVSVRRQNCVNVDIHVYSTSQMTMTMFVGVVALRYVLCGVDNGVSQLPQNTVSLFSFD